MPRARSGAATTFTTPVIALSIVEKALAALEWALIVYGAIWAISTSPAG